MFLLLVGVKNEEEKRESEESREIKTDRSGASFATSHGFRASSPPSCVSPVRYDFYTSCQHANPVKETFHSKETANGRSQM